MPPRIPFAQAATRASTRSAKASIKRELSSLSPAPAPAASAPPLDPEPEPDTPAKRRRTRSAKRSPSPLVELKPSVESAEELAEVKLDPGASVPPPQPLPLSAAEKLRDRKLKAQLASSSGPLFPDFPRPTAGECKVAHGILRRLHGARNRPKEVVASKERAGCGDSPSVLDALVRTILSQNTSDTNSSRAKRSMDGVYGSSDNWSEVVSGGEDKLEEAIRCGGLSRVKSRVIVSILQQVHERYGVYSLDHLHAASTEEAMQELLSFKGVGPKTASCVLLFCLAREDFAVDTHVHRITGLLGWRPARANREQTYAHLNQRIPDEDKYGLHILLVTHGKRCDECKAGGRNSGKCELRRAFRQKIGAGAGAGEGVKGEGEEEETLETKEEDGVKDEEL